MPSQVEYCSKRRMAESLMKTYDYHGWKVSADDPMYQRFISENKNIIQEDQNEVDKLIKKYLKQTRIALDIGCHYGFFTKFLSHKFNHVHAFDFDNDISECFRQNMETHSIKNLTIHPYGLGEIEKSVATNDRLKHKGGQRGPLGNHVDTTGENKNQKIKALDILKIENIDLMMIDTEGYELNVLNGAEKTINKYKPMLIIEFHHRNLTEKFGYSLKDLETYIKNLGYQPQGSINKVDRVFVHRENLI